MREIRVGLIGFGYASRTFHAPLIRATDGLSLVTVASSDARKVRARLGSDVAITTPAGLIERDDIDLVVVATPNQLHHPQALAALEAGHHVVVDKPFALNVSQAEELVAAARKRGRVLSVFHNRRWDSDFLTLASLLRAGRLGRVVEMVSHFDRYRPAVRARWRESAAPGAGLWMDLGPHLIDQALQLFGRPTAIAVDMATLRDGGLADDWFHAQLRWSHGVHAGLRVHLHASVLAARPAERFIVHGTLGSFAVAGLDVQEERLKAEPDRITLTAPDWGHEARTARLWLADGEAIRHEDLPLQNGAYPVYYAALRDTIRGVGVNPVAPADAIAIQTALELGLQSARDRREVIFSA